MSFCRQRTLRLFVLPISLVTALLLYLGVHATAYAATGDDWVFSSQVPISPDPVYAQETPAIDGSYVAWQGGIDYNGATKNRIFFKDMNDAGSSGIVLAPPAFTKALLGDVVSLVSSFLFFLPLPNHSRCGGPAHIEPAGDVTS